jgi:hypothetical protein
MCESAQQRRYSDRVAVESAILLHPPKLFSKVLETGFVAVLPLILPRIGWAQYLVWQNGKGPDAPKTGGGVTRGARLFLFAAIETDALPLIYEVMRVRSRSGVAGGRLHLSQIKHQLST